MTENGVGFAKKVGIVVGAILATVALGNTIGGCAMKTMILPEIQRISVEQREALELLVREERMARIQADEASTRDRIRLLSIMERHSARDRLLLLQNLKEEVENSQPRLYGR